MSSKWQCLLTAHTLLTNTIIMIGVLLLAYGNITIL